MKNKSRINKSIARKRGIRNAKSRNRARRKSAKSTERPFNAALVDAEAKAYLTSIGLKNAPQTPVGASDSDKVEVAWEKEASIDS